MYGAGTAKLLVKNNLRGIFTMAEPREPVNESVIDMTADLFVAKYGGELSVFGALYYYASYLTEFHDSYGRFDLQDVLRQCGRAYLPWWRNKLSRKASSERDREQGEVGKAALWSYLRREYVSQGRSVRESNLYRAGMVPEEDVEAIESGREILF